MSESIGDKKVLVNSHGNDSEKTVSNLRYQTIFPNAIDNFGKHLIGKFLSIELNNNKVLTGKLRSFGQYDVILTDQRTGQDILIMKSAIVTVQGDFSTERKA